MEFEADVRSTVEHLRGEFSRDLLLGNCEWNADELATLLDGQGMGWDVAVVTGAVHTLGNNGPRATTAEEAYDIGSIHYWVVVEHDEVELHCDLATPVMYDVDSIGDPLVLDRVPDDYVEFSRAYR
jgi:hypothetical protein